MHVLQSIFMVIAIISGIALILSVMMQTNKAESFSAAMGGGGDQGRFRKGSREEMLDRITKYAAIVWISACALNAIFWYQSRG
ncbi:MAG: preprotein translocase subunit SecG [Bacteroidota bacterium]